MKIAVAGGGPAGLFFAALAAKSGHDVTLSERNPRGATYGWGVVFSEGTLGALAEIDREVHRVIDERAVQWSAIEVLVGGQTVHSTGHGFSAVSRRGLLEALQEVCESRSVQLRFEEEVDPADPFPGADLVVAADGVRSQIRELHRGVFRPELKPHPTRYVWYGTTLPLDAFTFVFEDTPAGLMQVHAYPYDRANSTFIVECTEEVWRGNGLDAMDEEASLLFCEKVFADVLDGHRLLSNRSEWLQFATLRCRTWHTRRLAMVGDAAHTAHFSIGSGTKLAMEDAASLHRALSEHPDDLAVAFADYETDRMPAVDRFQQAALESSGYFEQVSPLPRSRPGAFHLQPPDQVRKGYPRRHRAARPGSRRGRVEVSGRGPHGHGRSTPSPPRSVHLEIGEDAESHRVRRRRSGLDRPCSIGRCRRGFVPDR